MAAPAFATMAKTSGTGNNVVCTMPSGITAGDLLIAHSSAGAQESASTSATAGWTKLSAVQRSSGTCTASIWGKVAVGSDTITITGTNNTTHVAIVSRYTGHSVTSGNIASLPIAVGALNIATADPPILTPAGGSAEYLWLAIFSSAGGAITAGPSGYSNFNAQGANPCTAFATKAATASSENPGTFSGGGSNYLVFTLAIPPVAGAANTSNFFQFMHHQEEQEQLRRVSLRRPSGLFAPKQREIISARSRELVGV